MFDKMRAGDSIEVKVFEVEDSLELMLIVKSDNGKRSVTITPGTDFTRRIGSKIDLFLEELHQKKQGIYLVPSLQWQCPDCGAHVHQITPRDTVCCDTCLQTFDVIDVKTDYSQIEKRMEKLERNLEKLLEQDRRIV